MTPLISVVVPLYNKAEYIRRTLDSVLAQTCRDYECIVVDDGSRDDGPAIVAAEQDPRVRLITQRNAGVSAARNAGVAAAQAPLIAFLDADDEWLPTHLEEAVACHRALPGLTASFSDFKTVREPSGVLAPLPPAPAIVDDYFAFVLANGGVGMWTSAVVSARAALQAVGGFPVGRAMGEDIDTWCRLALHGRVALIPCGTAVYHTTAGACRQSESNADIYPSLERWRRQGLLAGANAGSVEALADLLRLFDLYDQLRRGNSARARALYEGLSVGGRHILLGRFAGWLARNPWSGRIPRSLGWRIGIAAIKHHWRRGLRFLPAPAHSVLGGSANLARHEIP